MADAEDGEGATGGWEPVIEADEPMCEPYNGRDYVEVVVEEPNGQQWTQAVPAWERDLYQRQGSLVADRGDTVIAEAQREVGAALAVERAASWLARDDRERNEEGRGR